jgi:FemAB-related protein (PEP-CTERM system-associated)
VEGWRVVTAGENEAAAWNGFVEGHAGAATYHQYVWRDVMRAAFGVETHYLMARGAEGGVGGILPLARLRSWLFGDFLVSLPYFNYGGPLTRDPQADAALLAEAETLARRLGVSHVELREVTPREPCWPVRTDKVAMVLDLEADHPAQLAALGAKLRSQVRRPQREGARVERGGAELLPKFYRVFARNMRDLGTPVYSQRFFAEIAARLGSAAEIVVVSIGDVPTAAAFLLHFRSGTEIPWASSLREWNRVGVNMLLYWESLKAAIDRGSRTFDFGRSTVNSGTYRFKAQWGAAPRPLYWHYWLAPGRAMPGLNPDNPKFAVAIRVWQSMPLWATNVLGPPIVRRLP